MNRTIVEMAHALLTEGDLPPHEAYTSNKPFVAHLRIFGCKEYAHVPKEKRQKLDKKTMKCIHLGYSEHKNAYLLLHRSSGRIVESRDVHFDEGELVEPTRVRIETEVTQDEAETRNSPVTEVIDSESDSESSVDLEELLDVKSDGDDDDGDDSDSSYNSYGTAGSTADGVSPPKNAKTCPGGSVIELRATPTSPSDSAT